MHSSTQDSLFGKVKTQKLKRQKSKTGPKVEELSNVVVPKNSRMVNSERRRVSLTSGALISAVLDRSGFEMFKLSL